MWTTGVKSLKVKLFYFKDGRILLNLDLTSATKPASPCQIGDSLSRQNTEQRFIVWTLNYLEFLLFVSLIHYNLNE